MPRSRQGCRARRRPAVGCSSRFWQENQMRKRFSQSRRVAKQSPRRRSISDRFLSSFFAPSRLCENLFRSHFRLPCQNREAHPGGVEMFAGGAIESSWWRLAALTRTCPAPRPILGSPAPMNRAATPPRTVGEPAWEIAHLFPKPGGLERAGVPRPRREPPRRVHRRACRGAADADHEPSAHRALLV